MFKAAEMLSAGSSGSLIFKLYEGEISTPVTDNRLVGCIKLRGTEIATGIIRVGDDLVCDYEISDSGRLSVSITVPSVGGTFVGQDFYSRQEGGIDFSSCQIAVQSDAERTLEKIQEIEWRVPDCDLQRARQLLDQAHSSCEDPAADPEATKEASQKIQQARSILSGVRTNNLPRIRQAELDRAVEVFDRTAKEHARPSEQTSFEAMTRTAERSIGQLVRRIRQYPGRNARYYLDHTMASG